MGNHLIRDEKDEQRKSQRQEEKVQKKREKDSDAVTERTQMYCNCGGECIKGKVVLI